MGAIEKQFGPYIVWQYAAYEGWHPQSFDTLADALLAPRYHSEFIVTSGPIDFMPVEIKLPQSREEADRLHVLYRSIADSYALMSFA